MKLKINDGERVKVVSRRGEGVFPAVGSADDPAGYDLYSLSLGRGTGGESIDKSGARSDFKNS